MQHGNNVVRARQIMRQALKENGYACSCGESRYRGRPCTSCRMAAFLEDKPPQVMFIGRDRFKYFSRS